MTCVVAGGWFPIALAFVVFLVSAVWFYGRDKKSLSIKNNAQYVEQVLALPPPG
jgi:K+ transporter